jgi:hypothetical protein
MTSSSNRGGGRGAEMWGIGGRRETMSGSGAGTGEAAAGEAGTGTGGGETARAADAVTQTRSPEAAPQHGATSMREKRRNQPA